MPGDLAQKIRTASLAGLEAIYPHRCASCGIVCEKNPTLPGFCRSCMARIPFRTAHQSRFSWADFEMRDFPSQSEVFIATWYQDPVRQILLRLKFGDSPDLAEAAATILFHRLSSLGFDCRSVMAVPLHPVRERDRGYNQAGLIACSLSRKIGRPDWSARLIRIRPTERQSSLSGRDIRKINVAGAFRLQQADPCGETDFAPGLPILLIDDILTTGATLAEAARPLIEHGFSVSGLVVSSERHR